MNDPVNNILEPSSTPSDYTNYSWTNNCLPAMSDLLLTNLSTAAAAAAAAVTASSSPSNPTSSSLGSGSGIGMFDANSSSSSLSSDLDQLTRFTNECANLTAFGGGLGGGPSHPGLEDPFIGGYSSLVLEFTKILYGIVCLVGLCGNTLVIYVVLRFSKMQTVTNMYIFNLALADEMFLIGLPFLIATVKYKSWPFGQIMCQIYMITTSINQFTSSLLLTVMSADRYIAVCHPISSPRYRTPFIAKFICLTVWTVSALLMVPIFMYTSVLQHAPRNTFSCNIVFPENEYMNGQRAFTLYSFTLGFFIPFILIFLFYILVICKLRTVGPKNKSKEKKRSHRKVTYLVLTVITVYVGCWLPYWIGQVYITFQTPNVRHSDLCVSILLLAGCLSYANSAVNPILYAFLSDNFKKSFAKAFTCAAGKDINAQLHVENSVFPRTTRGSQKGGHPCRGGGGGGGGHRDDFGFSGGPGPGGNTVTGAVSGTGTLLEAVGADDDGCSGGGGGGCGGGGHDGEAQTFVNLIAQESNLDSCATPSHETHEFFTFDPEPSPVATTAATLNYISRSYDAGFTNPVASIGETTVGHRPPGASGGGGVVSTIAGPRSSTTTTTTIRNGFTNPGRLSQSLDIAEPTAL